MVKRNFLVLLFTLFLSCGLEETRCDIISPELLVYEKVNSSSNLLNFKRLNEKSFRNILEAKSILSLELKELDHKEINLDFVKSISLLSSYNPENDELEWEKFKELYLADYVLYNLGHYIFEENKLYLILSEFPDQKNSIGRCLYILVDGKNHDWIVIAGAAYNSGMEDEIASRTIKKGDIFTYIDYSDSEHLCTSFKIKKTGEILHINSN